MTNTMYNTLVVLWGRNLWVCYWLIESQWVGLLCQSSIKSTFINRTHGNEEDWHRLFQWSDDEDSPLISVGMLKRFRCLTLGFNLQTAVLWNLKFTSLLFHSRICGRSRNDNLISWFLLVLMHHHVLTLMRLLVILSRFVSSARITHGWHGEIITICWALRTKKWKHAEHAPSKVRLFQFVLNGLLKFFYGDPVLISVFDALKSVVVRYSQIWDGHHVPSPCHSRA